MELPGEECTDSVSAWSLIFFALCLFLIFYRFAVCVCVFALLVCFCQVQPAIGAGCVYIAQRLRAAIGGFKAKRQRNGNSCRCRR